MDAVQGQVAWLPALLQDKDTGAGMKGIAWNASGLTVKYQNAGGTIQVKTLTSGDWAEGVDGSYNIRFSVTELNTLGLFSYWLEHPQSTTYPGAVIVIAAPESDIAAESTLLSVGTTVGQIKNIVDSIPTDVANAASINELKTAIQGLPTDVASGQSVTEVGEAINNLKTAVEALPTNVATGTDLSAVNEALAALKTTVEAISIPESSVGVGFSMNATQRKAMWLPAQLTRTGLTFDAVTVKYQKSGGAVVTKTLTAEQWSEGVGGSYSIYFVSDELDTLGTFRYWVECTGTSTYPGVAFITEAGAGSGALEKTIRIVVKGQPIKDCEVWVTSDAAGKDKIAGPRLTDVLGMVTVFVDPGDYWVHYRKAREVEYNKMKWSVRSDG